MTVFFGRAMGMGTGGEGERGGVAAVLGIELVTRSQIFEMAVSCVWWMVVRVFLTAQEGKFRAWTMWSPSVTVGWVR